MATSTVRWNPKPISLAGLIAWHARRQLESEQKREQRFPAGVLQLIFIQYVSGETDISSAMLLSQVSSYWRQAAHNLQVLWKPFHIKPSAFYPTLSRSIQDFDIMISPLPKIFSVLDIHITLPRGTSWSASDLISDCDNGSLRAINITAPSPDCLDHLLTSWRLRSCASLRSLAVHSTALQHNFRLAMGNVAFSKSLQTLKLFDIDGISMPALLRLEVLVLSGSKKRIPAKEVVVFLSELPHLQRLELHGTPIHFESTHSKELLPFLLPAQALPLLTAIRIIGLRPKQDITQKYLGRLLALVSFKASITSLEVETGKDLDDLSTALRTISPLQPHFPNLRTTTFHLTAIKNGLLQGLLKTLSSVSHAVLWLSPSFKEYTLVFKHERSESRSNTIPCLKHMQFRFSTDDCLQEFLDIASRSKHGLKTVKASYATLHELRASRLWTLAVKDKALCNHKQTPRHAHILYEGQDYYMELCLEPTHKR